MIAQDIILDIKGFIEQHPHSPRGWYVGLASDAEEMLFKHHKVDRQHGYWIYRMADSSKIARLAHGACLQWECDGEPNPKPFSGHFVYAYLKAENTKP